MERPAGMNAPGRKNFELFDQWYSLVAGRPGCLEADHRFLQRLHFLTGGLWRSQAQRQILRYLDYVFDSLKRCLSCLLEKVLGELDRAATFY